MKLKLAACAVVALVAVIKVPMLLVVVPGMFLVEWMFSGSPS